MYNSFIAHRGESYVAPENTISAIKLAWKNNVPGVEIDVNLTKDNEIVVIHDNDTKRTGNTNKLVKSSTLKELKEVDVGSFKDDTFKNERIPTLKEVLNTVPVNGKLIIEVKSDQRIIPFLIKEIKSSSLKNDQIMIIAFDFKIVQKMKQFLPEYKMLWLIDSSFYWSAHHIFKKVILNKVLKSGIDGVDVYGFNKINSNLIEEFNAKKLLVYVWTIDEPEKAKELIRAGVHAITTNRPRWLKEKLE